MALSLSHNFLSQIQEEKDKEYKTIKEIKKILKDHMAEEKNISLKRSEAAEEVYSRTDEKE